VVLGGFAGRRELSWRGCVGGGPPLPASAAARGRHGWSGLAACAASPPDGGGLPPFGGLSVPPGEAGSRGWARAGVALPVWVAFGLYLVKIFWG
jgi:hypothetical protein